MTEQQRDGWLADPTGRHQLRYLAAGQWTDNVSDNGVTGTDPLHAPSAPSAPAAPPAAAPGYQSPPAGSAPGPAPGYAGAPGGYQPAPGYGPPPAAPRSRPVIGFVLTIVGVLLAIVGAFLPWVTTSGFVSFSKAGTEGDGVITLVLAVLTGLLAVLMVLLKSRALAIGVLIGALLIGAVAVLDLTDISSKAGDLTRLGGDFTVKAEVGSGLWMTAAAAVLLLLGGIVGLARK